MNACYLDESGKQRHPLMGCYGIGVDRTLASIIEEHHDDKGIVWPMTSAPYQAAVIPIRYEDDMKKAADELYEKLQAAGMEVLLDDRNERPGVKFKDMDLLGIPVHIIVGDKNLPKTELKLRSNGKTCLLGIDEAVAHTNEIVQKELAQLNDCSQIRL